MLLPVLLVLLLLLPGKYVTTEVNFADVIGIGGWESFAPPLVGG